jgi:hypothetical protein
VIRLIAFQEHILKIGSKPCAHAALLGRGVDTDEDKIGLPNAFVNVSGEEEVAPASFADDSLEAWFVDREVEVWAVPCIDTGLIKVNNGHGDVRTF